MPESLEGLDSFGDLAAEVNFRPEFFVPSNSWRRIRDGKRPIAIGRKGSGKTALRLALLEEASHEPLIFAADLAFRDYPWKAHHAVFDERVGRRSRYVETWYFLILIEVAKLAVGEDQAQPISPDRRATVEALRVFLRDNCGHFAFAHHEVFTRPRYKLTKTLDPTILGNKLGSLQWTTVDAGHLGSELRDVNGWLRAALASILRPDAEYWVVFDELDLDFAPDEAEYVESITGLLIAVGQFQEWARSELEGVARAMLLLRDDIYDSLTFRIRTRSRTVS